MKKSEKKCRSTIQQTYHFNGKGLHFAQNQSLTLRPAPPNTGILLNQHPLDLWQVQSVEWATQVKFGHQRISTIEHLLAALFLMKIDDILIEVDGTEIPILDGSALPFYESIKVVEHDFSVPRIDQTIDLIDQTYHFKYLESACTLWKPQTSQSQSPSQSSSQTSQLSVNFDFSLPNFNPFKLSIHSLDQNHPDWIKIISARTFGLRSQEKSLRSLGLIQGVSLENCVIFDDLDFNDLNASGRNLDNAARIDPPQCKEIPTLQQLRFEHEYAYHKLLDFFGDLMRLNMRIETHIDLVRGSHALHAQIVDHLLSKRLSKKHM